MPVLAIFSQAWSPKPSRTFLFFPFTHSWSAVTHTGVFLKHPGCNPDSMDFL